MAPAESPVQVLAVPITGGAIFTISAVGGEANDPTFPIGGPDGSLTNRVPHYPGAEDGIANVTMPINAPVGVFLEADVPSKYPAPTSLDFSTPAKRDFSILRPALRQPFFIGDGLTSAGFVQQFVAPTGAARLFLGVRDAYQWSNNLSGFIVNEATNSTLGLPPAITGPPQSLANLTGSAATFRVQATGTEPLGCQWQFNGANLGDSGRISGSSTAATRRK